MSGISTCPQSAPLRHRWGSSPALSPFRDPLFWELRGFLGPKVVQFKTETVLSLQKQAGHPMDRCPFRVPILSRSVYSRLLSVIGSPSQEMAWLWGGSLNSSWGSCCPSASGPTHCLMPSQKQAWLGRRGGWAGKGRAARDLRGVVTQFWVWGLCHDRLGFPRNTPPHAVSQDQVGWGAPRLRAGPPDASRDGQPSPPGPGHPARGLGPVMRRRAFALSHASWAEGPPSAASGGTVPSSVISQPKLF